MRLFGSPNIDKMKANRDVDGLIRALTNKDSAFKAKAAKALGEIGNKRAIGPLRECQSKQQKILLAYESSALRFGENEKNRHDRLLAGLHLSDIY